MRSSSEIPLSSKTFKLIIRRLSFVIKINNNEANIFPLRLFSWRNQFLILSEKLWQIFSHGFSLHSFLTTRLMMLYRNTKVKDCSPDGDIDFVDIMAGVLQGDTSAPYLFILCLEYVLRTSIDKIKENGFKLIKKRSRRYPTKTITDADNIMDIGLLANAPAQAETLLHSLERAVASIGLYVNAHKTGYKYFNQTGDICTLNSSSQKLVDKFTYPGSSVSSTETDIDTWLAKAWTAIDRLWSYGSQTSPIKWSAVSSMQRSCRYCYMDALHGR